MAEYYMHPVTHKITQEESGSENDLELRRKGYTKVVGYDEARKRVKTGDMFVRREIRLKPKNDVFEAYVCETPIQILLSRDKLLTNPLIQGTLSTMYDTLAADETLTAWWAKNPVYIRNSPLALKAMKLFNLSQSQLELLVISCRQ